MGRIVGPFGVKGWVKIEAFTASPRNLLEYQTWWVDSDGGWTQLVVEQAQVQGTVVVAKFPGCGDRDAAAQLRGREIAVARSEFPDAGDNEYYWADLVGLQVVNTAGEALGRVARVFETGANDVLVVEGARERLIPFIEQVVVKVDLPGGMIRVDWGSDF